MEMAGSSNALDVSAPTHDLKYIQALTVNVSNFVSVKLSGRTNYRIWKAQMLCLIESQLLLHIINDEHPFPVDKGVHMILQYDKLVKGWIFGSVNENVLKDLVELGTAQAVWMKLESLFNLPISDIEDETSQFEFKTEFASVPELNDTDNIRLKKELYDAAVEGCWWKAKSILKINKKAAEEAITANGNTILHIAVEMGHNYFVEKVLEFLKDGEGIEKKNHKGRTALHIAAMVGNKYEAQLLVQKKKELLVIKDDYSDDDEDDVVGVLCAAIVTKQYDLAATFVEKFPDFASKDGEILRLLTIIFPSDLGFLESLIYPSFHNVRLKTVTKGSLLFHSNMLDKFFADILQVANVCNNTCCSRLGKKSMILLVLIGTLYPIYQLMCHLILVIRSTFSWLYFLFWKFLAITVPPIKNIEKKKKDYKNAKKILSLICRHMATSNDGYSEPLFEALRQDTYEVVDEILFTSPAMINRKDEEGYNIIQLAIINRSEKVYNLLYQIIKRTKSYREIKDSSENTLVHLAGRLAPSFVLNRTTGAALQLQRELLWFEEIDKLVFPLPFTEKNKYNETPSTVFTREHQDLMKEGEIWMKTTTESCSITAALIVTVVFAAAITVPGGSNQESGIPLYRKEIAFNIFPVSNAFSLFAAATALLLFLSILTTRFSEKDFWASLPKRLIFGLLTLFLSTTAMMVAFGAILFVVFCAQKPWMLAPICGFACLPILVIVTINLPLLVDLIRSTYFPIFGRKSYLDSCKINRKSTIFTD